MKFIDEIFAASGLLFTTLAGHCRVSTSVCLTSCRPPMSSQPSSLGLCRLTFFRDEGVNPSRAASKSAVVSVSSELFSAICKGYLSMNAFKLQKLLNLFLQGDFHICLASPCVFNSIQSEYCTDSPGSTIL